LGKKRRTGQGNRGVGPKMEKKGKKATLPRRELAKREPGEGVD